MFRREFNKSVFLVESDKVKKSETGNPLVSRKGLPQMGMNMTAWTCSATSAAASPRTTLQSASRA